MTSGPILASVFRVQSPAHGALDLESMAMTFRRFLALTAMCTLP